MKNAVVTGASGFVGSWLVRELLSRDVEVYAIIRRNSNVVIICQLTPGCI